MDCDSIVETKIEDLAMAQTINRLRGKKKFSPHIPLRLMNDKNVEHGVKVLFGMLYDYATAREDEDYPEVIITAQYLGEQLNRSRKTIWLWMKQLEALGLIEKHRQGMMEPNRYKILFIDQITAAINMEKVKLRLRYDSDSCNKLRQNLSNGG